MAESWLDEPAAAADSPDWWPYAGEFPNWHVWRGVAGLLYARRPRTSPAWLVRAIDVPHLRAEVKRAEAEGAPWRRHR